MSGPNRAARRWFARHGLVSLNRDHEWHVEQLGPSPTGWYWDGITARRPMREIVIHDGKVVAIR